MTTTNSQNGSGNGKKIDSRWFKDTIKLRGTSGRQLAKRMGMAPSAWSRVLSGERRLTLDETMLLASELRAPPDEIIERLGIRVTPDPVSTVPLKHKVGRDGSLAVLRPMARVPAPPGSIGGTEALRLEDTGESASEGWVIYYAQVLDVPPEALGRLCVVHVEGAKGLVLRIVQRAKLGRYTLLAPSFLPQCGRMDSVAIESASPVTWIAL